MPDDALAFVRILRGLVLRPEQPQRCHVRGRGPGTLTGATAEGVAVTSWRIRLDDGTGVCADPADVSWPAPACPELYEARA